jgi:hypothetical protein
VYILYHVIVGRPPYANYDNFSTNQRIIIKFVIFAIPSEAKIHSAFKLPGLIIHTWWWKVLKWLRKAHVKAEVSVFKATSSGKNLLHLLSSNPLHLSRKFNRNYRPKLIITQFGDVFLDIIPISTSFDNTKVIVSYLMTLPDCHVYNYCFQNCMGEYNTSLHKIWNSYRLRFIDHSHQMNLVKSRAVTVHIFLNKYPP